ncbi:hypothetical protein BDZ89DRAFT_1131677 [Hymenopellis radicata]|nr:hypothetical protein BDZ89DRAFT_1131677 [Hymenopellis radicata]
MAAGFPQELLNAIVDEVADLDFYSLPSLLNSSRCFGPQCRMHLYCKVTISARASPSALCNLIMQYNVGHFVNTLYVVFGKDDAHPFWSMVFEIMARLTRLKDVVLTELLSASRGTPPAKMLLADLPRSSTVRGVKLQYVRRLSVEDVTHVLSAYRNLSSLELSKCNMDNRDPSTTSVAPPVALETLSVVDAQLFIPSIFAGSVAPPIISLHKLRRLVVGGIFTQRIWPSYEGLFRQIQGTVKEVIIYTKSTGFPGETSIFVNVPSLIVLPPLDSDFDFLVDMLQVSDAGMHSSPGLKRLALVFNWGMDQAPLWVNLAELLAGSTIPFSVCITLAWAESWSRQSYHRTWSDIEDEVLNYFRGIKRLIRVQIVELDLAEWNFHMKSTEYLYH